MDLLMKTGAVKLRSHLDKFLVGDEDKETVRQSRNGLTKRAVWIIEPSLKNPDAIKLKNLYTELYLTASDTPFLLGVTCRRVVQLSIFDPTRVEWEPMADGFQVKFRSTKDHGKYLRANGGSPPWRNSVTHDKPLTGKTYNWVLWDVEPVTLEELGSFSDHTISPMSSFNSVFSDELDGSYPASPLSVIPSSLALSFTKRKTGMDLFHNAKSVRLKSHHDKFLVAEEDEVSVSQDRNGSSRNARWGVEFVDGGHTIRLKSCYGKYLTSTTHPFLLGVTGKRVQQTAPRRMDSSVEWEPLKAGSQVRLRTKEGNYLRANGGLPPWRNSVTHDVPHRTATQDWVLWDVDIVDIADHEVDGNVDGQFSRSGQVLVVSPSRRGPGHSEPSAVSGSDPVSASGSVAGSVSGSGRSSMSGQPDRYQRRESSDSGTYSPAKRGGRLIHYHILDEQGEVDDTVEGGSFTFKGHSVAELRKELEEETGLQDIYVCTRSPLNGKLIPLRLQLPPNNAAMHIVVVPSSSRLAEEFAGTGFL